MFELSILRKYLIPRKGQLAMTLIALMSVGVISLVVWLIVLFLSVTDGIEKTWLEKLTSLHAPVRITPTKEYLTSYHFLSDTISSQAHYTSRSLADRAKQGDLYNPAIDETAPSYWKKAEGGDPLQKLHQILEKNRLPFQEFELGGAMLRLQLDRPSSTGGLSHSFLSQASYLASFSDRSPVMEKLLIPPSPADLEHLLRTQIDLVAPFVDVKKIKLQQIPLQLLPEKRPIPATAITQGKEIVRFELGQKEGTLLRLGDRLLWNGEEVFSFTPLFGNRPIELTSHWTQGGKLVAHGSYEGIPLKGEVSCTQVDVTNAVAKTTFGEMPAAVPLWLHRIKEQLVLPMLPTKERGIVVAKQFKENGVKIGDKGWLSYPAATAGALQEQRLPIFVAGFYDPGVLAIGNKCILAPANIVHLINTTSQVEHFDKTASMGYSVWLSEIKEAPQVAAKIRKQLQEAGIERYWKVETYQNFDFAKDLLQQFQSDRYLFTLIGLIILLVACSNIISLLVILVSDKKREIGILQALGASRKSIAIIFGGVGVCLGLISSCIGVGAAFLTLKNLDSVVKFLSMMQGQDAFSAVFYGSSLPHVFSYTSVVFVLIVTPLLSLVAGLIPAWKACRLSPSAILRSE